MPQELQSSALGPNLRVAIVVARFNEIVTNRLLEGALSGLEACGVNRETVVVAWVPGSLEVGVIAKAFATSG